MTEENYVDFVDFTDECNNYTDNDNKNKEPESLYTRDNKMILYDDKTMVYYKTLRLRKMDPILLVDIDNDDICFKFKEEWNPYTGERLGPDPYGPLCFHPDYLIRHFYENRLKDIWVNESYVNGEYYEGYYDIAVGAGTDIYIQSRGYNPEWYLFRLPIIDCYCTKDIKNVTITMGPILTDSEVNLIDDLARKCGNSYKLQYGTERPLLYEIKRLYDMALAKKPIIMITPDMTQQQIQDAYMKTNRLAVDKLRSMKG